MTLVQVFFNIYFPVWVTLFQTNSKKQTLMFTLLTLGTPLGIIVGYIMTSLIITFFGDVPNKVDLILNFSGGMPSMRRPSCSYRWPYAS